jgi:hypothetical protein
VLEVVVEVGVTIKIADPTQKGMRMLRWLKIAAKFIVQFPVGVLRNVGVEFGLAEVFESVAAAEQHPPQDQLAHKQGNSGRNQHHEQILSAAFALCFWVADFGFDHAELADLDEKNRQIMLPE